METESEIQSYMFASVFIAAPGVLPYHDLFPRSAGTGVPLTVAGGLRGACGHLDDSRCQGHENETCSAREHRQTARSEVIHSHSIVIQYYFIALFGLVLLSVCFLCHPSV